MSQVSVHEAKTHLSELLRRVACGEEIIIARGRKPVARLVPVEPPLKRELGLDRGLFEVPEDFNAPLPEEVLNHYCQESSRGAANLKTMAGLDGPRASSETGVIRSSRPSGRPAWTRLPRR